MTTPTAATARPSDGSHLPRFHLNGSGRQALLDQAESVARALDAALTALERAAPHGRDFYTIGPDAYGRALAEFERRHALLAALRDDAQADFWELYARATG